MIKNILKKKKKKRGFTIIEVVVVIAVISLLATISTPVLSSYIMKSEIANAETSLKQVYNAIAVVRAVDNVEPNRYSYTDVEDNSEFMKKLVEYVGIKLYDGKKGDKIAIQHTPENGNFRIWYELSNGDRIKFKNDDGGIYEQIYKPDDGHWNYGPIWKYKINLYK